MGRRYPGVYAGAVYFVGENIVGLRMYRRGLQGAAVLAIAAVVSATPAGAAAHRVQHRPHLARPGTSTATTIATTMHYRGGPVISHLKLVGVLYGGTGPYLPQITNASAPNVAGLLASAAGSSYLDLLSEYGVTPQMIHRGTFQEFVTIAPSAANDGSVINDQGNIQDELAQQFAESTLPAPDADTLYVLFFRKDQVITTAFGSSDLDFCAYHNSFEYGGQDVAYAVLPDRASDQFCGATPGFGNLSSVITHEVAEAVTDPLVGSGWTDDFGNEIGDVCNHVHGSLVGAGKVKYVVQREWSNQQGKCATAGPVRWVSVGDASVVEGDAGTRLLKFPVSLSAPSTSSVQVDYVVDGGATQSVVFSVSGHATPISTTIAVPVAGNTVADGNRTVQVTIVGSTPGYAANRGVGTGTIVDDDPNAGTPAVSVGDAAAPVPALGRATITIPVTLSAPAATAVTVHYAVAPGTASARNFSGARAGTVTIPAGMLDGTIVQHVKQNSAPVGDVSFSVQLSSPAGAPGIVVGRANGTGTLLAP